MTPEIENLIRMLKADAGVVLDEKYKQEWYSTFEVASHLVARRALQLIEILEEDKT